MSQIKRLARDLNKKIRGKIIDKTAEDIAAKVYTDTREAVLDAAQRVISEINSEDNQARVKRATQRLGDTARRFKEDAREVIDDITGRAPDDEQGSERGDEQDDRESDDSDHDASSLRAQLLDELND